MGNKTNRKALRSSLSFLIAITLLANFILIDGHDGYETPEFAILKVSKGSTVIVYERTTSLNIKTFAVSLLMGSGGEFWTAASEKYTVTSDGTYVKIHCYRPDMDGGGHNIEAVKLTGVPGLPSGKWASIVINYTLGKGGDASTVFNALGGDYNGTYTLLGDLHSELVLGFEIDIQPPLPPYLYTEASPNKKDVILRWDPPPSPVLNHYLIYRATSQTDFDFNDVWVNTSTEINPMIGSIDPLNTTWLDTNVTNPDHPDYRDEYYYIIRAVNAIDIKSSTSNTAGYYVTHFSKGLNTFSVPLQPFGSLSLDKIMSDLGATSVTWKNPQNKWETFRSAPAPYTEMGKGYVIDLPMQDYYVFTGEPASMITYNEGFGFNSTTRDDIIATTDTSGNVTLSWTPIAGADKYFVFRSNIRDGFHKSNYDVFDVLGTSYQDAGAASSTNEVYYLIVPYSSTQGNGSSTYSIGVITSEYDGNEMFGLPLKPDWGAKSADWYVDQIGSCLGIVYLEDNIWKPHFKEFDEGVYDTTIERGRGYELTVYMTSIYSYIGW